MIPARHCATAAVADLLRHQPLSGAKVTFAWRTAVGQAVDRATAVALKGDGTLEVHAADEHWCREINRSADLIVARLGALLGRDVVKRITATTPEARNQRASGPSPRR